jgi:predicted DNA-binding transcriptional regulator AlpA
MAESTARGAAVSTSEDLRIIGPAALAKRLGRSAMSIHRWEKRGILPARITLGPRTLRVWRLRDIEAWLAQRAVEKAPT